MCAFGRSSVDTNFQFKLLRNILLERDSAKDTYRRISSCVRAREANVPDCDSRGRPCGPVKVHNRASCISVAAFLLILSCARLHTGSFVFSVQQSHTLAGRARTHLYILHTYTGIIIIVRALASKMAALSLRGRARPRSSDAAPWEDRFAEISFSPMDPPARLDWSFPQISACTTSTTTTTYVCRSN